MENRSGCTIELRGKGTRFPYDNEPANAFINGDNAEAVDAASMMVESLIDKYASSCLGTHDEDRSTRMSAGTHGMKTEVDDPQDEDSAYWL
jgi:hypothetical protein